MTQTFPIHFAPLQGYTEVFYRNAHTVCFGGIDTYCTFKKAEQPLPLFIEKGYKEVDINMGCPFPMLTKRHNDFSRL